MTTDQAFDQVDDLTRMMRQDALPMWHRLSAPGHPYPTAPLTVYVGADDVDSWRPFLTITAETSQPHRLDPGWFEWRVTGRLKTAAETPVVLVAAAYVERPAAVAGRPA